MNKTLVFDMDGTLNRFYDEKDWLKDLKRENPRPYVMAQPKVDMEILNAILMVLKSMGWRIAVTSWLANNSSEKYKAEVRKAKIEWLEKYNFPYDEIHIVAYGTTKANCTRKNGGIQILVDDNERVRKGWKLGGTIDANENILKALSDLLIEDSER